MQSIEERITKILLDTFRVPQEAMHPAATFADLSFDSLVLVELVLVLGSEFGVPLADGDLRDTMTVADAAVVLVAKGAVP